MGEFFLECTSITYSSSNPLCHVACFCIRYVLLEYFFTSLYPKFSNFKFKNYLFFSSIQFLPFQQTYSTTCTCKEQKGKTRQCLFKWFSTHRVQKMNITIGTEIFNILTKNLFFLLSKIPIKIIVYTLTPQHT